MLGHANDDPLILTASIEYLEFFEDYPDADSQHSKTPEGANIWP
jgi:hypothetical protein